MISMEVVSHLQRGRNLIEYYSRNLRKYLELGEYLKASEMQWGIINILASMISLITVGKPVSRHNELRMLIQGLAVNEKNSQIIEYFRSCEILHNNFYHNFLNEEELKYHLLRAEELINILQRYLYGKLKENGIVLS